MGMFSKATIPDGFIGLKKSYLKNTQTTCIRKMTTLFGQRRRKNKKMIILIETETVFSYSKSHS